MHVQPPVYRKEGISRSYSYTITEDGREIRSYPYKWFQVTITNDSEDYDLYALINDQPRTNPTIIKAGEPVELDFDEPTIWRVELWTDTGETVDARIDTMR